MRREDGLWWEDGERARAFVDGQRKGPDGLYHEGWLDNRPTALEIAWDEADRGGDDQ